MTEIRDGLRLKLMMTGCRIRSLTGGRLLKELGRKLSGMTRNRLKGIQKLAKD